MIDSRSPHDEALHLLHAPVCVVGTAVKGRSAGLTAAWVSRVSLDPVRILVAVSSERHTWGVLNESGAFSLSILREDQLDVGRLFGLKSGREMDKWAQVAHVLLKRDHGVDIPALASCSARILCRTVNRVDLGDHEGFVGEVIASEIVGGGPALPMRGRDWIPSAE